MESGRSGTESVDLELERTSCPLCEGEREEFLFEGWDRIHDIPGRFRVVRCADCSLIYVNPRPTRESMRVYYPARYFTRKESPRVRGKWKKPIRETVLRTYFNHPSPGGEKRGSWIHRILALPLLILFKGDRRNSLVIPFQGDGRFLDVGCGGDRILGLMKKRGWNVAGVEIDPTIADRLAQDYRIFQGELTECSWEDDYFDVILMSHLVEHLHDPVDTLRKARRLLKKGGRIYLRLPDGGSFAARRYKSEWYGLDVPRHLCTYTRETMTELLRKTGFTLEYIKGDRNSSGLKRTYRIIGRERTTLMTLLARVKPFIRGLENLTVLLGIGDAMIARARRK